MKNHLTHERLENLALAIVEKNLLKTIQEESYPDLGFSFIATDPGGRWQDEATVIIQKIL